MFDLSLYSSILIFELSKTNFLTRTAMPLRSELTLAAVEDVLGTVFVLVSLRWILLTGTLRALLATFIK